MPYGVSRQSWFRLDKRKKFSTMNGKTLEWAAQRSDRCPIPGRVKVRDFGQPALVEEVPAHDNGLELDDFYRSLPTQIILWFFNSMIWNFNGLGLLLHPTSGNNNFQYLTHYWLLILLLSLRWEALSNPSNPFQFQVLWNHCDEEITKLANVYTTHIDKTKFLEQGTDF